MNVFCGPSAPSCWASCTSSADDSLSSPEADGDGDGDGCRCGFPPLLLCFSFETSTTSFEIFRRFVPDVVADIFGVLSFANVGGGGSDCGCPWQQLLIAAKLLLSGVKPLAAPDLCHHAKRFKVVHRPALTLKFELHSCQSCANVNGRNEFGLFMKSAIQLRPLYLSLPVFLHILSRTAV